MSLNYDEIADRCIDLAVTDGRIRALWAEADSLSLLRRPYQRLELHMAADEPDFPGLLADVESLLAERFSLEVSGVTDTQRFAKQLEVRLGEKEASGEKLTLTLILEQSHLLAKRPRAEVVPLVDKTNHLIHVMDFSARRK